MARAISDEEFQLKRRARRRLIGAIVLVTVIIVVLPMVLDSEPKPVSRDISVQIPSPDAGTFTSKVVPLPPSKAATGASKAAESKAAARPVEEQKLAAAPPVPPSPEPVKAAPKETAKETSKPAKAAPAKAPKPAAKPAGGQFAVQVIALADAEKAKQMQAKITAAGIKAYTEIVKTAKGDVTRVRAGPFATREAAEKAREQLKAIGMNGNVTTR
jgi:DedD protein